MVNMLHDIDLFPNGIKLGVDLHAVAIRPPHILLVLFQSQLAKPLYRIVVGTFRVILDIKRSTNILTQLDLAKTATCE